MVCKRKLPYKGLQITVNYRNYNVIYSLFIIFLFGLYAKKSKNFREKVYKKWEDSNLGISNRVLLSNLILSGLRNQNDLSYSLVTGSYFYIKFQYTGISIHLPILESGLALLWSIIYFNVWAPIVSCSIQTL